MIYKCFINNHEKVNWVGVGCTGMDSFFTFWYQKLMCNETL